MAYFEKDSNIIRLNFAKKNKLITEDQYLRIKEYLDSKEDDVYELGATTLKSLILKSSM
jgi:hypothetical protein